jgi:hypothetical protein
MGEEKMEVISFVTAGSLGRISHQNVLKPREEMNGGKCVQRESNAKFQMPKDMFLSKTKNKTGHPARLKVERRNRR